MDDFKQINEQYGHLIGDKVLRSLAVCIKSVIRTGSEAIRFGGDEFIVILENTTADEALPVAERIRASVAELSFADCPPEMRITVSIGLIEGAAPMNDLIAKADMAMYGSKSKGKNRTTLFNTDDPEIFHMRI